MSILDPLGFTQEHIDRVNQMKADPSSFGIDSQFDYAKESGKDLVSRAKPGLDVVSLVGQTLASPFYDTYQGIKESTKGFDSTPTISDYGEIPVGPTISQVGKSIADQKIGTMMGGRFTGGLQAIGEKLGLVDPYSDIAGQTAFIDPVSAIIGAGKIAKGAGVLDVMKNIFVNKARKKVTEKALKAAKDALAAKKAKEAAKAAAAKLESQRRGRRPGTGGDGPGVQDSGGPTGGYSYDSGGRQGFGYGLKKGGSVKSKPEMKLDKAKRDSALYQGLYMMLEELPGIMSLFFKNGGVVKTDLTDTIPPERGPMSSGVESLFKRK